VRGSRRRKSSLSKPLGRPEASSAKPSPSCGSRPLR
jgi:hypothetical protein